MLQRTAIDESQRHRFASLVYDAQRDLYRLAKTAGGSHIQMREKWISRHSAYTAKQRAKELDVWNQIRRTEEEPMEMGIRGNTLLRDGTGTEGRVSAVEKLSKIGAGSTSETMLCFI